MQVKLYKKIGEYVNQAGEKKQVTNYFVECGDVLVPVEVKYFEDKVTHEDKQYRTRRTLMSAFGEELPERRNENTNVKPQVEQKATDDPTS